MLGLRLLVLGLLALVLVLGLLALALVLLSVVLGLGLALPFCSQPMPTSS